MMSSGEGDGPQSKKQKIDLDTDGERFKDFQVVKVLNDNTQHKTFWVQGRFKGTDDDAVVLLEKTPFSEESVKSILAAGTSAEHTLQNDIYGTYQLYPQPRYNGIKSSLIYPATQRHIAKYLKQEVYLVNETAQDYSSITLPYIEAENFSIQWVYNILEHKCEADRIVYEDPDPEKGFILLPDIKWDRKQMEDLYLVAIVHKHGIKSLRDLRAKHLPLLRSILEEGQKAIEGTYKVPKSKLRVFIHYQPSYYHLHVHFTHLHFNAPGSGCERGHLLTDVIENVEQDSDFYAKKTLTCVLKESDGLLKKFKTAGHL